MRARPAAVEAAFGQLACPVRVPRDAPAGTCCQRSFHGLGHLLHGGPRPAKKRPGLAGDVAGAGRLSAVPGDRRVCDAGYGPGNAAFRVAFSRAPGSASTASCLPTSSSPCATAGPACRGGEAFCSLTARPRYIRCKPGGACIHLRSYPRAISSKSSTPKPAAPFGVVGEPASLHAVPAMSR
jgi:hypothetical protein